MFGSIVTLVILLYSFCYFVCYVGFIGHNPFATKHHVGYIGTRQT